MIKNKWVLLFQILIFCGAATIFANDLKPAEIPAVPTPGLVTMVDLGGTQMYPMQDDGTNNCGASRRIRRPRFYHFY